jgi:hypothetical protein
MHASLPKQLAYNERLLSAENEIAGINCNIGEFPSQLSTDPYEPVIICVNAGESLKRHEQHIGGQPWLQINRQMTATNIKLDGMSNDATSVTLAVVAEAVEWAHVLETGLPKRTGQRIVIYPPSLLKLDAVLESLDAGSDTKDGHDIAYQRIFSACAKYERPPAFFPVDSQDFGGLDISEKIPFWMHTAAQVSTGGRRQVLENGPDVCDSESDSENEDHGEVLSWMYTVNIPLERLPNRRAVQALCRTGQCPESTIHAPGFRIIGAHHTGFGRSLQDAHQTILLSAREEADHGEF